MLTKGSRPRRTGLRRVLSWADNVLLVVVLVAGGAWTYRQIDERPAPPLVPERTSPEAPATEADDAAAALASLEVKGRAPRSGYERKHFAVGGYDLDRNGCDVRNDTLRRDLASIEVRPGSPECVVERGTLLDPYTGQEVVFVRGVRPSPIEIDHIVALSDAWQKGAQQWTPEKRVQFGNDPRNLVAVSREANQAKKDSDAASWLPPDKRFRCTYVAQQISVKAAYGLWVTSAERDAMARVLETCT